MSGSAVAGANGPFEHGEGCACVRCQGFPAGNLIGQRHGAYPVVSLAGRAGEVAEAITGLMIREDIYRDSFAPTVQATAMVLVRLERAERALEELEQRLEARGESPLAAYLATGKAGALHFRLRQDARGWSNTLRGYLADLGLSPAALARISRDSGLGRAARASAALRALEEHVEREYGPRGGEEGR